MRMLIIDDSATMRRYLTNIADRLDIDSEEACDGLDALHMIDAETESGEAAATGANGEAMPGLHGGPGRSAPAPPFDVALVDWDMPRMNGVEFVRAVRARPDCSEMKLMMVTSHNGMSDVRGAILAGADDYLMKPLDASMVEEKLRLMGVLD